MKRITRFVQAGIVLALLLLSPLARGYEVINTTTNRLVIITHRLTSEFQYTNNTVRVLLPDKLEPAKEYRVLYLLPVEAGVGGQYGDGLLEVAEHNLHNRFQLICVSPEFDHLPWYADHPTDLKLRQESYLLQVVLPFIESKYPVGRDARHRLLLGFSKSGWGAFSLLLRHPDVFGKAAAWDAPVMKEKPDQFGMGPIFGTQENFEKYEVIKLLPQRASELKTEKRLILTGYENFREQGLKAHELMQSLGIAHEFRDGPLRKHVWESGWVEEAVELLAGPAAR